MSADKQPAGTTSSQAFHLLFGWPPLRSDKNPAGWERAIVAPIGKLAQAASSQGPIGSMRASLQAKLCRTRHEGAKKISLAPHLGGKNSSLCERRLAAYPTLTGFLSISGHPPILRWQI